MSLTAIVLATLSVPRPSDLPCGKRRAFVDLGANDGQSLEWFRKHWEPRAPAAFTTVVAFELNPVFAPVLRGLLARWEGTLVGAAAWTSDGEMAATIQQPGSRVASKGGVLYNMTSSALEMGGVPLNKRARSEHRSPHEVRRRVPTVDLAAWLSARFCAADVVDVKMDIEGCAAPAEPTAAPSCCRPHACSNPRADQARHRKA